MRFPDPASAIDVEAEFDYEQGQFIYDVELRGHGEKADVGIDRAKEIAVGHAGVKSSDVVFSKAKLERDDDDDNDEDD